MNSEHPNTVAISSDLIRQELSRILESRHFRHSKRSREFLQFVVEQKILGNEELLKERWIGSEVFGRNLDYSTGDDPIVRVQAGEVRRRLDMYQTDVNGQRPVCVELPLGSYAPVFRHGNCAVPPECPSTAYVHEPERTRERPIYGNVATLDSDSQGSGRITRGRKLRIAILGTCVALALVAAGIGLGTWYANRPATWIKAFWGPAMSSEKPVLICLSNPVVYQPSVALFDRYAATHPGAFASRVERRNRVLPLNPQETFRWNDMEVIPNSGPAIGGVRAAMNIGALFGRNHVPFSVRFGKEASFPDLRESPAVIVGALNVGWMMQMSSDLHFSIQEDEGEIFIRETGPTGRTWRFHKTPAGSTDYALITRQLNAPSGQFTVKIEGIGDGGTQAGSEILSDPESLRGALHGLPTDWAKKNVQLVVSTVITDGKPGPPTVAASYVW